jgi:hypothetical protein
VFTPTSPPIVTESPRIARHQSPKAYLPVLFSRPSTIPPLRASLDHSSSSSPCTFLRNIVLVGSKSVSPHCNLSTSTRPSPPHSHSLTLLPFLSRYASSHHTHFSPRNAPHPLSSPTLPNIPIPRPPLPPPQPHVSLHHPVLSIISPNLSLFPRPSILLPLVSRPLPLLAESHKV